MFCLTSCLLETPYCHGFDWDRLNFLHRGLYDAVFWIFDENSSDNTLMFCCCRVVLIQSRISPLLILICSEEAEGVREAGRGQSQDSWPQLTKRMSHTWDHAWQYKLGEKKEEGGGCWEWRCLPSQVSYVWQAVLSCVRTSACQWEVLNGFLILPCLNVQLLLYLVNCLS